ncbi:MAG: type II secretion system protein [Dehalobacter sp. 4CP]|jgi:type II secretory pathway pseudopilin PulG|nr:type II secretion system protein [Dehalobacter sp. 4CP]
MKLRKDGFTAIDLVMVIIIAGILAVTVAVKWPGKSINIYAQADQVVQDIRYAQSLAMARATTGQRYQIVFASTSYTITNNIGTIIKTVPLDTGLAFTSNGFTGGYLSFDSLGRPYNGTVRMTANLSVAVTGGGFTKTITVWRNTGAVEVG